VGPTQPPIQLVPGLFTGEYSYWSLKLTFDLHVFLSLRVAEVNLQSPIPLRGVVPNYMDTRITSLFNVLIRGFGLFIILAYMINCAVNNAILNCE
jgi:hypothetical protein